MSAALEKNAMERRNTDKDDFEKQLDYAIDAFDVSKSINERIINNEKSTLAERELLTEETIRLADSAFKNQVGLVEDYTKQKIDFEKLLKMTDEAEKCKFPTRSGPGDLRQPILLLAQSCPQEKQI